MNLDQEKRILEILDAVLDLGPGDRTEFLDGACKNDSVLRAEVEACIETEERAHWWPVTGDPEGIRQAVGPYRILRELGRGGMGTVYLAERSDGAYEQRVAIKVLKRGMDTDHIVQRFRAERQILARMDHPNIAKLLDGGSTEDGLPYLVMEYVEGTEIIRYCAENQLTLHARLELFRTLCDALAYAHRNLVVHRDIKPSNVLVSATGTPKLLDFGIAKLLHPESEGPMTKTAPEFRFMTPDYACPEQVRGEPATTALDVYGLGLLLFELLTGQRPFRFESKTPEEFTRVICETEPEKPSAALTGIDANKSKEAGLGRGPGGIKRWQRALKGDLDTIVLTALRKDPSRRYASAAHLSEDILRYLGKLPVLAQKESVLYHIAKFIARHRVGMAMTGVFVTLLLVFSLYSLTQSHWLRLERERVVMERDKYQKMVGFLVTLFSIPNLATYREKPITAKELLDQGVVRIERGPYSLKTSADLLTTMGVVYRGLGLFEQSASLLEKGLTKQREVHGNHHPDVTRGLNEMGELYMRKGEYDKAEHVLRQALQDQDHLTVRAPVFSTTLHHLAEAMRAKGDYKEAEAYCREALQRQYTYLEPDHIDIARSLCELGLILHYQARFDEALAVYQKAMVLARKSSGENQGLRITITQNQASVYQDKGAFGLAEKGYLEALSWQKETLGDVHPNVAQTLNNLGTLMERVGRYEESEQYLLQALAINRQTIGENNPLATSVLHNLAGLSYLKGDYPAAELNLRKVISIDRKSLGESHPELAKSLAFLGWIMAKQKAYPEAEALYQKALRMQLELVGRNHPEFALNLSNYGMVLRLEGNYTAAEPLLRDALAIHSTIFGENHPRTSHAMMKLAQMLLSAGAFDESEYFFTRALEIQKDVYPTDLIATAKTRLGLGQVFTKQRRYGAAEAILCLSYDGLDGLQEPFRTQELLIMLPKLIDLYGVRGDKTAAAQYRDILDQLKSAKR